MAWILAAAFGAFLSVNVLIPVLPLYLEELGRGSFVAGTATSVFMFGTVATQIWAPRILRRWSYKPTLVAGLAMLGAPAGLYLVTEEVAWILAITLSRGFGFGLVTVAFVALVAQIAPPGRRGEAMGLYGAISAFSGVIGLPLGVWLVFNAGYGPSFFIGVAAPLLGLCCVTLAVRVRAAKPSGGSRGFLAALARGPLRGPFLVFASSNVAAGFLVTFLPLSTPPAGLGSAATALLVWGVAQTGARWWAGFFGDRFGSRRLLGPSVLLCAAGIAVMSQTGSAVLLLLGAALNGIGYGVLQNATISVLMDRVSRGEYGTVSALWNVGFDAGTGLGPLLFGPVVVLAGFAPSSLAASGLVLAALILVRRDNATV